MPMSNFPWSELLTGGGAAAATQLANLLTGRKAREVKALGDTIDILSGQLHEFRDDLAGMRDDLNDCHVHHQQCEAARQADRQTHQAELDELKANISRLLNEPTLPDYHPSKLKRLPK